jgi:hypothetical protein
MMNNENNPRLISAYLGSASSDVTLPVGYLPKRTKIQSVVLMNGADIGADDGNFCNLQLKNGSTVIAELDTREDNQGALTKNVAKAFAIVDGQDIQEAGSSLTVAYDETEGLKEIFTIEVPEGMVGEDLAGTGFTTEDDVASVDFWFDIDNDGDTEPTGVGAATRGVEINTIAGDDDAEAIAAALQAAIDADSKFVAALDPDNARKVIVTASVVGDRTDVADGSSSEATGLTFETTQQGEDTSAKALTSAQLIIECYPL